MREYKYRMWNGSAKKYHYDVENVLTCLAQQNIFDRVMSTRGFTTGYDHVGEGSAFEQFTGLQDKNGKDIYEGDLLIDEYIDEEGQDLSSLYAVTFDETKAQFVIDNSFKRDGSSLVNFVEYFGIELLEVKGNIHENPE